MTVDFSFHKKTYREALQLLYQLRNTSGKLGLENCQRLAELLHRPDREYPIIHVAGTNGKGSVVHKIAGALQAAGLKVGMFTSPHISCFRERIRVSGEMIEEEQVKTLLCLLWEQAQKHQIPTTFFELITLMAMAHFCREQVDVVVLETGLGGRLDATNICTPILSVITSIRRDHTKILGESLEDIAKEKAGIIKPGIPVVLGPRLPSELLKEIAKERGSSWTCIPPVSGTYDEENTEIARQALLVLRQNGFFTPFLNEEAVQKGISQRPACRMEERTWALEGGSVSVMLDAGHNPDALNQLFESLRIKGESRPLHLVLGLSKEKETEDCLRMCSSQAQSLDLVCARNGRGMSSEIMKQILREQGAIEEVKSHECEVEQAMKEAGAKAQRTGGLVVVCGSFFILSEARRVIGLREPKDEEDLNEKCGHLELWDKKFVRS